jgi:hypothetical protein
MNGSHGKTNSSGSIRNRMFFGVSTMACCSVRRLLIIAAVAALTASCGMNGSGPRSGAPFTPDIQVISDAIATAAKYPTSAVELTSSQVRLRISVSDAKLAMADETTRNSEAAALVAATEQILASHPEYAKLQAISVAIIHPSVDGDAHKDWHTEDVVEFRKGPNQRFSMRIT